MEYKIKIDFVKLLNGTGIVKGKLFYSTTFKSWVVSGSKKIDLICVNPPYKIGENINGKKIITIKVKNNHWVFTLKKCKSCNNTGFVYDEYIGTGLCSCSGGV
jgi:hypothetical protein